MRVAAASYLRGPAQAPHPETIHRRTIHLPIANLEVPPDPRDPALTIDGPDPGHALPGLAAKGAGIHRQCATDGARNPGQELGSDQSLRAAKRAALAQETPASARSRVRPLVISMSRPGASRSRCPETRHRQSTDCCRARATATVRPHPARPETRSGPRGRRGGTDAPRVRPTRQLVWRASGSSRRISPRSTGTRQRDCGKLAHA